MPLYTYKNVETGEVRDILQGMNDEHVYNGENGDEKWERVWHSPNMSVDSQLDPFSARQFVEKTGRQAGTVGDLWDQSAELSEKRAKITGGEDPVKKKYYEDYSKKRNGSEHPDLAPTKWENKHAKAVLDD